MSFDYCRERQDRTDAHIKASIISLQQLNKLAAQEKYLNNSVLSTNLKVAVILNLMYAAGYAGVGAEVGVEVGAEVDAEDDIAVAGIRFKLAVELNIHLELTEKVCILLRI